MDNATRRARPGDFRVTPAADNISGKFSRPTPRNGNDRRALRLVPPHRSRPGDRPGPLWPAAIRRLWLDGWERGFWAGHAAGVEQSRACSGQGGS